MNLQRPYDTVNIFYNRYSITSNEYVCINMRRCGEIIFLKSRV